MGFIQPGIPHEIAVKLGKINDCRVFIETGTYKGDTAKWASHYFDNVHTIELSESIYTKYCAELNQYKNLVAHLGDSRKLLPEILGNYRSRNILFWLDANWAGGEQGGSADDPCSLLKELDIILERNNDDIILIDDARLFEPSLSLPNWPTLIDIIAGIHAPPTTTYDTTKMPPLMQNIEGKRKNLYICNDVIFISPDKKEINDCMYQYILKSSVPLWEIYRFNNSKKIVDILKTQLKKNSFVRKIYYKLLK